MVQLLALIIDLRKLREVINVVSPKLLGIKKMSGGLKQFPFGSFKLCAHWANRQPLTSPRGASIR
jgi:hypothetical protein